MDIEAITEGVLELELVPQLLFLAHGGLQRFDLPQQRPRRVRVQRLRQHEYSLPFGVS
jgi:hypothetical protein